ncbi:MAG: nucleotidyltransferase family protein [Actinobacteria bacterium]|nr:nucleotidyltransferase family protein [Actinomycetota bacterium]
MGKKLDLLQANREAIVEIAKRNKGLSISVFGSVARGEDTESSDFDFLVEFAHGASFFDQYQMQEELSEFLNAPVDVVSLHALKSRDTDIRQEALAL